MAKLICSKCGNYEYDLMSNTHKVAFCSNCGTKLEKAPELPKCKCGNKLYPHEKFCNSCGLPREEALRPKVATGTITPMYGAKIPIPEDTSHVTCMHCGLPHVNRNCRCPECMQYPDR